jgi:hypothetical protein
LTALTCLWPLALSRGSPHGSPFSA